MNENNTTINNSGTGANIAVAQGAGNTGNVNATAQNIQNSESFQKALREFEEVLAAATGKLDARQMGRLEDKVADLKKPNQDRAWYSVTAQGLLDAAQAVKGIAAPVASCGVSTRCPQIEGCG
jgi:hypothetical protein